MMTINAAEYHRHAFAPLSELPLSEPNPDKKVTQVAEKSLEHIKPFPLNQLPKIAQYCVLSHLDLPALAEFSLASKEANRLVSLSCIWKSIAAQINCPINEKSPIIYKQVLHFIASIQTKVLQIQNRPETITNILKGPNITEINHMQQWLQARKTLTGWKSLANDFTGEMPKLNLDSPKIENLSTSEQIIDKANECTAWMQENKCLLEARDTLIVWEDLAQMVNLEPPPLDDLESPDAVIEKASEFSAWFSENEDNLIDKIDYYSLSANITSLPRELFKLTNITTISLSDNLLSTLPCEISKLSQLKILDLSDNRLSFLPDEICQLSSLCELKAGSNALSYLPNNIGQLSSLNELHLGFNRLTSLPKDLNGLTQLGVLELSKNLFTSLPDELCNLDQLKKLGLSFNLLTSLPDGFNELRKHLTFIGLGKNPIPPDSLAEQLRYALKKD